MPSRFPSLVALALCLAAPGLSGQRPEVAPTRLAEGESVKIDADFSEPIWKRAAVLGELTQVDPIEGAAPVHETVVRLAYDADALYLAIQCRDDPSEVRARLMARDARLNPDDRVEIWVDTYDTQRSGFWFQIGAGGSRGDALLSDGGDRFNKQWDGIWYGRSRVTERGWQAEIALPFKTLGFREGHSTWGFNFARRRRANGERSRWATPLVAYSFFNLSAGGALVGLEGMRQGVGVDVVPYLKANASRNRAQRKHTTRTGDFGLDVSYNISPSLKLLLTYNTDFAETEVDERQVNLSRFPLFFPEKRDFFLQDSGLFEFGRPGSGRSSTIPFFSRRIGLDGSGNPVPILGGVKLTGRAGPWNIGTLGTLIDETQADEEKALGVARVSRNIGAESAVGVIATGGRPIGAGDSSTVGADFRLKDSRFFGEGNSAEIGGYWVATQNEGLGGDGDAYGVYAEYGSRSWEHELTFDTIAADFDPQLGFVRRTGIHKYGWQSEYTWRSEGGFVRSIQMQVRPTITTKTSNSRDSWEVPFEWLELELDSEDEISFMVERSFERVPDFEVGRGVMVRAGDYTMTRHFVNFDSSTKRPVTLNTTLETGDFFSGNLTRWSVQPKVIPNRYFQVSSEYEEFRVRLDEGRFVTRVTEGRVDVTLSPDVSWRNLVQYDTASKDLTWQSRVHWILEPGHDLFLLAVYGWNRASHEAPLIPTNQDLTLKFSYTIRF